MSCQTASSLSNHIAPIIGYHRAPLSQKFGAPRQPNLVALTSVIEMIAPYDTPAAFVGLEDFSHIWVSWQFHHNYLYKDKQANKADSSFRAQVRPPRLGGNQKIGVFASRSMYRPSALGLSVVKLEAIEIVEGRVLLIISGADMIDGTPIIDIKPYVAYSDALPEAQSGFAPSAPHLLEVTVTKVAYEQFVQIIDNQHIHNEAEKIAHNEKATVKSVIHKMQKQLLMPDLDNIKALIAQDPRPAYRQKEVNTSFIMRYKSIDVSFQLIGSGELQITDIDTI
ncbi:tRNA (N6-threonylcarbamoyladenosine(37)-N6)-methyltransferase TrmO [Psychrobacter sp. ANT_H56B]|uniref:tRNA (N6-threonylcarbamoyladenosine(37)-N6)-methyltransferase TrmO n=1 Tax=unclassified Psychrobacter TaxID=196806 RepID=UPI001054A381|nr:MULTISPECIES: tRNA (N6-threonylcarbamoyladenosine(37)-N6)-methyltransferase TrmO [unclassified Psychrobacter]KAA0929402.1 tRNA (N6-threonylcarbamoyladenosine(37)-N6)-methyltransferase TrmO [Psychrobacter sp. ANT_H56B]KAA0934800.1 tRNA (N6-threonylcarbamoyladenosine(37)-N6)-methyltransferase TrmO [Psychrobacter sp. ANT_H59]